MHLRGVVAHSCSSRDEGLWTGSKNVTPVSSNKIAPVDHTRRNTSMTTSPTEENGYQSASLTLVYYSLSHLFATAQSASDKHQYKNTNERALKLVVLPKNLYAVAAVLTCINHS